MNKLQFNHWFWITFLTGLQFELISSDILDMGRVNIAQENISHSERALVREVTSFQPLKLGGEVEEENFSTRRSVSVSRVRLEVGEKKLAARKKYTKDSSKVRKKSKTFLESIFSKLKSFAKVTLSTRERSANPFSSSKNAVSSVPTANNALPSVALSQLPSQMSNTSGTIPHSPIHQSFIVSGHNYKELKPLDHVSSDHSSESHHGESELNTQNESSHQSQNESSHQSQNESSLQSELRNKSESSDKSESRNNTEPHESQQWQNSFLIFSNQTSLVEHKSQFPLPVSSLPRPQSPQQTHADQLTAADTGKQEANLKDYVSSRSKEARGRSLWGVDTVDTVVTVVRGSDTDRLGDINEGRVLGGEDEEERKSLEESQINISNQINVKENKFVIEKEANIILGQESRIYLLEFSNIVIIVIAVGIIFSTLSVVLAVTLLCRQAHKQTVKSCDQFSDVSSCSSAIPDKPVISYNSEGNRLKQSYLCDDLYSLDSDYFLSSLEDISVQM